MNKKILNEVKRNRELMGINESELDEQGFLRGVRDGIKKGFQKGKEAIKNTVDNIKDKLDGDEEEVEVENTETPIKVEEYNQTTIKTYNDYITVESITPGSRSVAQKLIDKTASDKGLGQQTKREIKQLDGGGYKVTAYFDK